MHDLGRVAENQSGPSAVFTFVWFMASVTLSSSMLIYPIVASLVAGRVAKNSSGFSICLCRQWCSEIILELFAQEFTYPLGVSGDGTHLFLKDFIKKFIPKNIRR